MPVLCVNCGVRYNSKLEMDADGAPPDPPLPLSKQGDERGFELDVQSDAPRPPCPRCGNRTLKGVP